MTRGVFFPGNFGFGSVLGFPEYQLLNIANIDVLLSDFKR